jgi:hypothetical protein
MIPLPDAEEARTSGHVGLSIYCTNLVSPAFGGETTNGRIGRKQPRGNNEDLIASFTADQAWTERIPWTLQIPAPNPRQRNAHAPFWFQSVSRKIAETLRRIDCWRKWQ